MHTDTEIEFSSQTLLEIEKHTVSSPKKITIDSNKLTIPEIVSVARKNAKVNFTSDKKVLDRILASYKKMMKDIEDGVPVYGSNTGFGAQASRVIIKESKKEGIRIGRKISEAMAHTDVSVGPPFEQDVIRAAMLIRINMLMRGVSAIKLKDLDVIRKMLNSRITPLVSQYGGIGASGDLAHNSRVLSAARQLNGVKVWDRNGKVKEANELLKKYNIPRLKLDPKAGLGFTNGDNFSTAVAALLAVDTLDTLLISIALSAMVIEALMGTNRSFHPILAKVRAHPGQIEISELFSFLLEGSKLAYQEMAGHKRRDKGVKVQDGYSLRCIAQYHAVNVEKLKSIFQTITINANSVSDNPIWVAPEYVTEGESPWQWVSGGNFIAMHMVEAMDALRKIMTQITKINDRHLARLVNPHLNSGLPANLSDDQAITQCTFKGVQIQSGMFDVYSSLLSIPVSTFFGVHEEGNQDITSHALTSGILGLENLRITRYSIAQNLLAVAQAIDLRKGSKLLSPRTRPLYDFIRRKTAYVTKERPLNNEIELLYESIKSGELMNAIRKETFSGFKVYQ